MGKRVAPLLLDVVVVLVLWWVGQVMLSVGLGVSGLGDAVGGLPSGLVDALFVATLPAAIALYVWWKRRAVAPAPPPLPPMPAVVPGALAADWFARAGAAVLDVLAVLLLSLPVGALLFMPLGLLMERVVVAMNPDAGLEGVALSLLLFGVVLWSGVFLAYATWGDAEGGTWGKRKSGLVVIDLDGQYLGLRRSLLRQLVRLVEFVSVVGLLVVVAAERAPHDRLAGSIVVPAG